MRKFKKLKKVYRSARELAANKYAHAGAALTVALAPVSAFAAAGGDMVSGFTDEITASKGQLWLVGGAVLGVCAISFLIGRGKRTAS